MISAPKFTFHVVASVYRFSIHALSLSLSPPSLSPPPFYLSFLLFSSLFLFLASPSLPVAATAASDPPASRRLYIASGKILRRIRRAWPRSRDESIRELPPARRTAGSQSVAVNIGRPFSIYFDAPSVRALPRQAEPMRESNGTEIDGHSFDFRCAREK